MNFVSSKLEPRDKRKAQDGIEKFWNFQGASEKQEDKVTEVQKGLKMLWDLSSSSGGEEARKQGGFQKVREVGVLVTRELPTW